MHFSGHIANVIDVGRVFKKVRSVHYEQSLSSNSKPSQTLPMIFKVPLSKVFLIYNPIKINMALVTKNNVVDL